MRAASRAGFDRQLARFQTRLRTRNADTDQYQHINNAVIASFFEEARMAIFLRDDLAACMREKRVVVAHLEIDFLKEIFYPGDVEIWTESEGAGTTSFALMQGLYAGDVLCARAKAVCVLLDSDTARPTTLPDALRERLAPSLAEAPLPLRSND